MFWNGAIANIQVVDTVLSAAEIALMASNEAAGPSSPTAVPATP